MPEQEDIEQLRQAMLQPKKVEVDNKTVEQHDLRALMEFDRYLESKKAQNRRGLGIRFAKMEAGGASR